MPQADDSLSQPPTKGGGDPLRVGFERFDAGDRASSLRLRTLAPSGSFFKHGSMVRRPLRASCARPSAFYASVFWGRIPPTADISGCCACAQHLRIVDLPICVSYPAKCQIFHVTLPLHTFSSWLHLSRVRVESMGLRHRPGRN